MLTFILTFKKAELFCQHSITNSTCVCDVILEKYYGCPSRACTKINYKVILPQYVVVVKRYFDFKAIYSLRKIFIIVKKKYHFIRIYFYNGRKYRYFEPWKLNPFTEVIQVLQIVCDEDWAYLQIKPCTALPENTQNAGNGLYLDILFYKNLFLIINLSLYCFCLFKKL